MNPLIQLEAVLSNNAYYNNLIKPITYEGYPLEGRFRISDRDEPCRLAYLQIQRSSFVNTHVPT
jgi:hypothetical protein